MQTLDQMNHRDIERLKNEGRWYFAGQLAALRGYGPHYGCHYGMKSTRPRAIEEFEIGWSEIESLFRRGM